MAVILCGRGSHGSEGIRDIGARGGVALAQSPATAEYDGMPAAVQTARHARLRAVALYALPVAQLMLDRERRVIAINGQAKAVLSLGERDMRRPLQDLEISCRPVELRSLVDWAEELVGVVLLMEEERP